MDELISYFNQEVSKMDISQDNKMKLLGMITAIGYENKKQEVVRCGECKYYDGYECSILDISPGENAAFYCAAGKRKDGKDAADASS